MNSRFLALVLHSHLPYVVNHGTWPHGLDWLHEATAETYLPLLRVLAELEQKGTPSHITINFSPILCEQLRHPYFRQEFPRYLQLKIEAARKDRKEVEAGGEDPQTLKLTEFWESFFGDDLKLWERWGGDILAGFKHFNDTGQIEVITCAATHGFFPLLGTDSSIRAQVRTAVAAHKRHFGRQPRGIWLPECGYRPRGIWSPPVQPSDGLRPTVRAGIEEILQENGIEYFFVDTHLVERHVRFSPYELLAGNVPVSAERLNNGDRASLYIPHLVATPEKAVSRVTEFTRDPRTGLQVWSGEHGYPGDPNYLDFHKKRWPSGLRYWQVTHPRVDLSQKTLYYPQRASGRTVDHARHFAFLCGSVLNFNDPHMTNPPLVTAPFDAELFGHWWFEGPQWIQHVVEELSVPDSGVRLISCGAYLDHYPPTHVIQMPEGSWGSGGGTQVWLNPETAYTWPIIYEAETATEKLVREPGLQQGEGQRLLKQLCRELLLLESSDWQFLITTQHARDYAEMRFATHQQQFHDLESACKRYIASGQLNDMDRETLDRIEARDFVFPDITPEAWK